MYSGRIVSHLNIPNEGVNSDVEWLDEEDFEEPDRLLPTDSVALPDHEEVEINLRTVQIEETDDSEEEVTRGSPSNVGGEVFSLDGNRTTENDIHFYVFTKEVGTNAILPGGPLALKLFLVIE